MTVPTLGQRMLAPKNAAQVLTVNSRTYTVSAGGYADVLPAHAAVAEANGWAAFPRCLGVGPTASRPGAHPVVGFAAHAGDTYMDTTLAITILFDGSKRSGFSDHP